MKLPKVLAFFSLLFSIGSREQPVIDFISDTQQPMTIEKVKLRPHHNIEATSLLLNDILKTKPAALFMLGDVVALGSNNHKWQHMDQFLDSCRRTNIAVHALLGNHDVMWTRRKGEIRFQKRFPDHIDIGYTVIIDSVAMVILNSNFSKLTNAEINKEVHWYDSTLKALNTDSSIITIIVSCHHAPYSNSLIVGSSIPVQHYFVPAFMQTTKCRLFITGHAHAFEHFQVSGKDFLVIGGGGGLHQPLDTSAKRIPDLAFHYKPMFHYLSVQRNGSMLMITSHYLLSDFSSIEKGYSIQIRM
jgi:Icc-related predicted phosphoesterase